MTRTDNSTDEAECGLWVSTIGNWSETSTFQNFIDLGMDFSLENPMNISCNIDSTTHQLEMNLGFGLQGITMSN